MSISPLSPLWFWLRSPMSPLPPLIRVRVLDYAAISSPKLTPHPTRFSHSFTRQGHLVHLPGPYGTTLHLSITRISLPPSPDNNSTSANVYPAPASSSTSTSTPAPSSEPFFVQLQPSRAVQPVGTARTSASGPDKDIIKELGLTDMMTVLQQVAGRIEGVHWETGR